MTKILIMASSKEFALPLASEFIEVLWITDDDTHFWWKAIVLDIEETNKGKYIAKATLQYLPGPNVPNKSTQSVKFLKDHSVASVKRGRGEDSSSNTWRFLLDEDPGELNDVSDFQLSYEGKSNTNENKINTKDKRSAVKDALVETEARENIEDIPSIQCALEKALDRISATESAVDVLLHSNRMREQPFIVSDVVNFARRSLVLKLMAPLKKSLSKHLAANEGEFNACISSKTECSLSMFQVLVKDIVLQFQSKGDGDMSDQVQFVPSKLSILYPSYSVPAFHINLRYMKNVCDILHIRDIKDREQCISKAFTGSSSEDCALRVLGTVLRGRINEPVFYIIGSDTPSTNIQDRNNILFRKDATWDIDNSCYFNVPLSVSKDENFQVPIEKKENDENRFSISWKRLSNLPGSLWTSDCTRNPDSQLGELSINLPAIHFIGKTAMEIDSLLTRDMTNTVLLSDTTSAPPQFL